MSFDFEDASVFVNNLTLEGNTLGSRDVNGPVNVVPDGSGNVNLGNLDSTVRLTATKYASAGLLQVDTDGNVLTTGEFTYRGTTNATSGDPVRTIPDTTGAPTVDRVNITSAAIGWDWVIKTETTGEAGEISPQKSVVDSSNNIVSAINYTGGILDLYNAGDSTTPVSSLPNLGIYNIGVAKYVNGDLLWRTIIYGDNVFLSQIGTNASDDSIYVTGSYTGVSVLFRDPSNIDTNVTLPASINAAGLLVKYTSNGYPVWAINITAPSGADIKDVSVDVFGNVYIIGNFSGASASIYNADGTLATSLTTVGTTTAFIARYTSNGFLDWAARIGVAANAARGFGIRVSKYGESIYVCGDSFSTPLTFYDAADVAFGTTLSMTNRGIYLAKYSGAGSVIWVTKIDGSGNDSNPTIGIDSQENIYISGRYDDVVTPVEAFNSDGTGSGNTLSVLSGVNDSLIAKYDSAGFSSWITRVASSAATDAINYMYIRDEHFYVVGYYNGSTFTAYDAPGGTVSSNSVTISGASANQDGYVTKYDANGIALWVCNVTGNSDDVHETVFMDSLDNIYVSGESYSTSASFTDVKTSTPSIEIPKDGTAISQGFIAKLTHFSEPQTIGLVNDTVAITDGSATDVITSNLFIDEALGGLFVSNTNYYLTITDTGEYALTTTPNNSFIGTALDENTLLMNTHFVPSDLTVTSLNAESATITGPLEVANLTTDTLTSRRYAYHDMSGEPSFTNVDTGGEVVPSGMTSELATCVGQITGSEAASSFAFGDAAVSIYGNTAVVGDASDTSSTGAAYIFERSGGVWAQTQKITGSDVITVERFGRSVCVYQNTIVVGAQLKAQGGASRGAAYVFTRAPGGTTWTQTQKLTPTSEFDNNRFGQSVAVYKNYIAVGTDTSGTGGSVYMYESSDGVNWNENENQRLQGDNPGIQDRFGFYISLFNDTLVAGARNDLISPGFAPGTAYVFNFQSDTGSWTKTQVLTSSNPVAGNQFGHYVSLYGDTMAVSELNADGNRGAAHMFDRDPVSNVWQESQLIIPADVVPGDLFGISVSVYGNTMVAGAGDQNSFAGAAYLYTLASGGAWTLRKKLTRPGAAANDSFGYGTAVYGTTIMVTAYGARDVTIFEATVEVPCIDAGSIETTFLESDFTNTRKLTTTGLPAQMNLPTYDKYGTFTRTGTTVNAFGCQTQFIAADGTAFASLGDSFGTMYMFGNTIIAAAPGDNADTGALYVLTKSGGKWSQSQKLVGSGAAPGDISGYNVSMYGDYIVMSNNFTNAGLGEVYVFERNQATGVWAETQVLVASDGVAGDEFGQWIAIFGGTLVVGARLADIGPNANQGAAYVFALSSGTWTETQKLIAPDGVANDQFGVYSAVSEDTILVGTNNAGKCYVYAPSAADSSLWSLTQIITGPASFGQGLSISNDTFIAAELNFNGGQGKIHVYTRINSKWVPEQELVSTDITAGDNFTNSSALFISGNIIVGGAKNYAIGTATNVGAVVVFEKRSTTQTWEQTNFITPYDGASNFAFGSVVSVYGSVIAVGAPRPVGANDFQGAIYIYDDILEVPCLTADTLSADTWEGQLTFADTSGEPTVTALDSNGTLIRTGLDIDAFSCEQKLTASDTAAFIQFGWSVSISGNVAIVGARLEDSVANDSGAAYIFEKSGGVWKQVQKIKALVPTANALFGQSVSISGNVAIVGAYLEGIGGAAYIFEKSGGVWPATETQKLTANNPIANDRFGWSVGISGNIAIVGAPQEDSVANGSGAAYIFEKSGGAWPVTETQKLKAANPIADDQFGYSVSISGNIAIVGAPFEDSVANGSGAAYIFEKSGGVWPATETQKLKAANPIADDQFGYSVSLSGNIAIVGAPFEDSVAGTSGAAYIFEKSGGAWPATETQKLKASDAAVNDQFGISVSISGNIAIVGAHQDTIGGIPLAGSAYIYQKSGGAWPATETKKLIASDVEAGDLFGFSVSISGTTSIVGAQAEDAGGVNSGAAYFYDDTLEVPCLTAGTLSAETITGTLTFADMSGEPTVTALDSNGTLIRTGLDIDPFSCEQKLTASDAELFDEFGVSVSISGNVAIVGADFENVDVGAAYIFEKSGGTWTETQKLTASDAAAGDNFGIFVSISGNVAIVGAAGKNAGAGAAYIFEKSGGTWTETQKLTASDAAAGDNFGVSVSISGNVAIVGASREHAGGLSDAGAAYIFEKSGGAWAGTETQKITASDAAVGDNFGRSVSISGNVAIVGAYFENANAGAAYIFEKSGGAWAGTETQKITASGSVQFGISTSISGNVAIVGSNAENAGAGAAYIFEKSGGTWTETQKLTASDAAAGDNFGRSVSISGNIAIVGAESEDTGGINAGAAYIFEKSGGTWTETLKIIASDAEAGARFGFSVCVDGNIPIVGAVVANADAGAAYIYDNTLEVPCLTAGAINTTGATTVSPSRINAAGGDALGALSITTGLIFVTTTVGAATPVNASLPNGLADGQILRAVGSNINASAPFNINATAGNITDANGASPAGLQLQSTGDSIILVWDATETSWFILGAGAVVF